jgi:acetyltransferase-like isoleucine patch superfamily enzyme
MFEKYKYKNWRNSIPSNLMEYLFTPTSINLKMVNFVFQRIFGINKKIQFMVHYTSQVSGKIEIGKDVAQYLASCGNCYIQGINGIKIGDYSMIAPGVKIISANHDFSDYKKHISCGSVVIGKNCWIGANAIILPEVELGDNVIVGAGSVVTKSFGPNMIIAGNPAKSIKHIERN